MTEAMKGGLVEAVKSGEVGSKGLGKLRGLAPSAGKPQSVVAPVTAPVPGPSPPPADTQPRVGMTEGEMREFESRVAKATARIVMEQLPPPIPFPPIGKTVENAARQGAMAGWRQMAAADDAEGKAKREEAVRRAGIFAAWIFASGLVSGVVLALGLPVLMAWIRG